jgi:Helix-turn-helix domain
MPNSLDLIDASRHLGCHPVTLRRAVLRGEIAHHRIFGRIRFLPEDLDAFFLKTYRAALPDSRPRAERSAPESDAKAS